MRPKLGIAVLKVVVFIAIAVGTALFVNKLNNRGIERASAETSEATLPLAFCEAGGKQVNRMSAYTQVMSTEFMRRGLVPVTDEKTLTFVVADSEGYGKTCDYELRSISGDTLIERGELEKETSIQGRDTYKVKLRMDLSSNAQYVVCLILNKDTDAEARYYTRIVRLREEHLNKLLAYVSDFNNACFERDYDKVEGNIASRALKDPEGGNSDTLAHVDLDSSYSALSFGGLKPMRVTTIVPEITELDEEYASIAYSYVIENNNEEENHYYRVQEYYTVHYDRNTDSAQLLAFDRYMTSFFDESDVSAEYNGLRLGVMQEQDVKYKSSKNDRICAVVCEGQLWCYDHLEDRIRCIFSFSRGNYQDIRTLNPDEDINILNMDDEGNLDFAVYGYMNRGRHEGKNGISLMHYDASTEFVEELFFLSCDQPFDVLKREVGKFTYYDAKEEMFYFLFDGALYKVSIKDGTTETLITELNGESYAVSKDMRIVAYPVSGNIFEASGIVIRNFETGEEFRQEGNSDDCFKILGFVNEDLIYGKARKKDIIVTSYGEAIPPLYEINIMSPEGEELKKYAESGVYVMSTRLDTETIYLDRAVKRNDFFDTVEPDYISYNREITGETIALIADNDENAYRQLYLCFPNDMYLPGSPDCQYIKEKNEIAAKSLDIESEADARDYYVYDNAGFYGAYASCGKAILVVNDLLSGTVVDANGNTVYRRIIADSYNTVAEKIRETRATSAEKSLLTCAYMCIRYLGNEADLKDVLAAESYEQAFLDHTYGVGLNISGVDLTTALYFLDRDCPFAANIGGGHFVLVISYNDTHIRYYDPLADEEVKVEREEFEELMSKGGNELYTYASQ